MRQCLASLSLVPIRHLLGFIIYIVIYSPCLCIPSHSILPSPLTVPTEAGTHYVSFVFAEYCLSIEYSREIILCSSLFFFVLSVPCPLWQFLFWYNPQSNLLKKTVKHSGERSGCRDRRSVWNSRYSGERYFYVMSKSNLKVFYKNHSF